MQDEPAGNSGEKKMLLSTNTISHKYRCAKYLRFAFKYSKDDSATFFFAVWLVACVAAFMALFSAAASVGAAQW